MVWASPATVGAWKSCRSEIAVWKASRMRAKTWVARSEWPPRSKKSSCAPTETIPSTSLQMAATASSTGPLGATNVAASGLSRRGSGSARRSTLPLGVRGSAASTTNALGTIASGVYFYRLETGPTAIVKKMLFVK